MEWLFSSNGLVTIVSIIVILILLSVLVFIIFLFKTMKDIRDTANIVQRTTKEIDEKGFVPFMKDSQLKSDLLGELKAKLPKIIPIITSGFIYTLLRKMTSSQKNTRRKNSKK